MNESGGKARLTKPQPTQPIILCSTAYGCGEAWADHEYTIRHPIWHSPKQVDLCEDCFQNWCEALPHDNDANQPKPNQ